MPEEVEDFKKKADEYLNNWKRAQADFENYKKGELERAGMIVQYAREDMVYNILPLIDSIYLLEKHITPQNKQTEKLELLSLFEGVNMIKKQIEEFLKREGIEEIEVVGKIFDPATMEIVEETPNTQHLTPNTAVEELQKGYKIGGKVLRPAKVKISK